MQREVCPSQSTGFCFIQIRKKKEDKNMMKWVNQAHCVAEVTTVSGRHVLQPDVKLFPPNQTSCLPACTQRWLLVSLGGLQNQPACCLNRADRSEGGLAGKSGSAVFSFLLGVRGGGGCSLKVLVISVRYYRFILSTHTQELRILW